MAHHLEAFTAFSDTQLISEVKTLVVRERDATVRLIAALAEMDRRRLFLQQGCSSLFAYCTNVLRLSEHATYGRIEAARTARKWPVILECLADGSLTLTAVGLLAKHLTEDNHVRLLSAAMHKTTREVQQLIAQVSPQADVPASIRRLTVRVPPGGESTATPSPAAVPADMSPLSNVGNPGPTFVPANPSVPVRPPVIAPLAPERFKLQITISRHGYDHLRRAQNLLSHVIPNGDPAAVVERALSLLVTDLEKRKLAQTDRPRPARPATPGSRHVPAAVRREVWRRDGGRCAFVGSAGPCGERGFLEFHHVIPFAEGGRTSVENLQLRCRSHNVYEADVHFGHAIVKEQQAGYCEAAPRVSHP